MNKSIKKALLIATTAIVTKKVLDKTRNKVVHHLIINEKDLEIKQLKIKKAIRELEEAESTINSLIEEGFPFDTTFSEWNRVYILNNDYVFFLVEIFIRLPQLGQDVSIVTWSLDISITTHYRSSDETSIAQPKNERSDSNGLHRIRRR